MKRSRLGGSNAGRIRRVRGSSLVSLCIVMALGVAASCYAEELDKKADASAAVADKAPADGKAAEKSKAKTDDTPAAKIGDKKDATTPAEVLRFRQEKIAAEMTELEQRMFRLSEALKALEPENSSRLMLGLKFAREELILHQMKETQQMLGKLDLDEASAEEKQLLSKLQRLHDLLLSTDLDFQVQLERLRQIREILRRLDKAIVEEDRERKLSQNAAGEQKELEGLRKKRATLEDLIKRQREHLEQGGELAKTLALAEGERKSLEQLAKQQETTRVGTKALAAETAKGQAPSPNLSAAEAKMGEAVKSLEKAEPKPAVPPQREALAALEKEREAADEAIKDREAKLAEANFNAMRRDQSQNRQLNEGITELVRNLGDSGAGALGELLRADGSMSGAEGKLGQQQAEPASMDQQAALDSLNYAKEQLEEEAEKLLEQLRAEVKRRVLEGLNVMLEKQIAVREATELLGPKAASGSRQALTSIVSLGKAEQRIIDIGSELLTLVEETEFGIALPAALLVVLDEMSEVQELLAAGDGSEPVINAERQIEADLKELLEAMKQMPSKGSNQRAQRGSPDRRRELNRLIAELKLIRMLQQRTNRQTSDLDGKRPVGSKTLPAALRQKIETLADQQDHVREAVQRLADERGDEVQ
ncbi:MAG TPA: hypothetical protein VMV10_07795 [Pirellulales bacterium]|nr:hypothetical protein [Pirellulales bacterium]